MYCTGTVFWDHRNIPGLLSAKTPLVSIFPQLTCLPHYQLLSQLGCFEVLYSKAWRHELHAYAINKIKFYLFDHYLSSSLHYANIISLLLLLWGFFPQPFAISGFVWSCLSLIDIKNNIWVCVFIYLHINPIYLPVFCSPNLIIKKKQISSHTETTKKTQNQLSIEEK